MQRSVKVGLSEKQLTNRPVHAIIPQYQASEYRGVEQLEARRAHNPEVVGSSPASATKSVTVVDTISTTVIFYLLPVWGFF